MAFSMWTQLAEVVTGRRSSEGIRFDIVSIFPEYFAPLQLSLVGKAMLDGVIDIRVHDLRDHTTDRHRSVDDTPYGGGPGMLMSPEPWGSALDAVRATGDDAGPRPLLIIPTPSGERLTQELAHEWANMHWLVFACGRYEGIDARVAQHYGDASAQPGWAGVREVSLGDYVLAGGEVAVLVMVEAVTRLLPGVVSNAASITDDSFAQGAMADLVEGPAYTRPRTWRGLEVPEVLVSGNHAMIDQWRAEQSRSRTKVRRPDLGAFRPDR